ncbi:amidase family protein [Agrobacterium tumefaciens]|uniref:amidase family protein n=1 Tax=Rhizobium/Agrobacterium group TaxID=227290 RepID=UPI001EEEC435|nr:amidase family protein [Agrobacterium tumefaciens]
MELWDLTLTEAKALLGSGEITSLELVSALLDRAEALQDLNAFAHLDRDAILGSARDCDAQRKFEAALPLLHGLPISFKDNIACVGMPMRANTPALQAFELMADATVAAKLKSAGAIPFGKNTMHEIAFGGTSNNSLGGPVRNPFDTTRVPAGSSGGTGSAVGGRLVPAGIGSDTGGSVRVPAAFNGIFGYRPSTGRWSGYGVLPLSNTRDTLGPLARSVADLDLIDSVVSERQLATKADLPGLRLGKPSGFYWENLAEDVRIECKNAIARLADAGATIVEIDLVPLTTRAREIAFPIVFFEAVPVLTEFLREWQTGISVQTLLGTVASPDVAAVAKILMDPTQAVPPSDYRRAIEEIVPEIAKGHAALLAEHRLDAIVYPTSPITAPKIGDDDTTELNGERVPTVLTVIRDWERSKDEALKAGAQWLVVEHDSPKDPAASIKASLGYLKTLESA